MEGPASNVPGLPKMNTGICGTKVHFWGWPHWRMQGQHKQSATTGETIPLESRDEHTNSLDSSLLWVHIW